MPARSDWKGLVEIAAKIGINLFPWQQQCARYLTAKGAGDHWLYREVAIIVARQNGKTTILVPLIVQRMLAGQSVMHTAQNAKLPREVHELVATALQDHFPERLPAKRAISYAVGHESIKLVNPTAHYSIVAPTKGGARGPSRDLVIVDELREMESFDFIAAAKPTLTASRSPQMLYLSNAGSEGSEVLNALRARAGYPVTPTDEPPEVDPNLAYLEWSAGPDRKDDEFDGWLESNPSIGHIPDIVQTLHDDYRADRLSGKLAIFETEHLCRWVQTMREPFVSLEAWAKGDTAALGPQRQVYLGVALDPEGSRASAALAWRMPDESVALRLLLDVTGSPIDADALGKELRDLARRERTVGAGHDPLTDRQLAKFLRASKAISGSEFANASAHFAQLVEGGKLRWHDAAPVTDDLTWTTRKPHDESGSFQAVRADDERPITASLAAIRAVWLASNPPRTEARIL